MAASNPYAPPTAHVTDVDDDDGATQPLQVLDYKGRIGRLRYLAWTFAGYFVVMVLGMFGGVLSAMVGSPDLLNALVGIVSILFFIPFAFWTIQRSHDMGWNGWTWLLTLIPLVILVWWFNGGTKGRNRYGAPPPPNTIGVHLLSWIVPIVLIVLVVAVAVPTYQKFAERAKAMQKQ
jgi:uncharacterized membrane protein YhaH (DUF805 family)